MDSHQYLIKPSFNEEMTGIRQQLDKLDDTIRQLSLEVRAC